MRDISLLYSKEVVVFSRPIVTGDFIENNIIMDICLNGSQTFTLTSY